MADPFSLSFFPELPKLFQQVEGGPNTRFQLEDEADFKVGKGSNGACSVSRVAVIASSFSIDFSVRVQ